MPGQTSFEVEEGPKRLLGVLIINKLITESRVHIGEAQESARELI